LKFTNNTSTDSSSSSFSESNIEVIGLNNAFQIIAEDDVYVFDFPDFDLKVKYVTQITDNIHEFAKNAPGIQYAQVHKSGLIPYPFYTNEAYLAQKLSEEEKSKKKRKNSTSKIEKSMVLTPPVEEKKKGGIFKFFKSKKHLKEEKSLSTDGFSNVELGEYEIAPDALPKVPSCDIPNEARITSVKGRELEERFFLAQATHTYRPHKFFNSVGVGQVDSNGVMSFHRGDVLVIFEKPNADYVLVKKAGLNSDPDRKQSILESYIPRDFDTLRVIMNGQRNREGVNAGDPPNVKQLRRIKHHFIQVRDLLNELLEFYSNGGNNQDSTNVRNSTAVLMGANKGDDLLQKMDLLSLFEASEQKKKTSSGSLDQKVDLTPVQKRKSLSAIFGTDTKSTYENEEEESLFRNLINLYEEWNEVGLVPIKFIDEFQSNSTTGKLSKLIEWRNEQEERKVRNFVIKKKKPVKAVEVDDLGVSCSVLMQSAPKIDSMKEKEVAALIKKHKK